MIEQAAMSDAMAMPLWVVANILIVAFTWKLSRALSPSNGAGEAVLEATILYLAWIIGTSTLLGAVGCLRPPLLVALTAVVGGIGAFWPRPSISSKDAPSRLEVIGPTATAWHGSRRWIWSAWALLTGFLLGHILVNGLLSFPTEFDGLAYHIPLIDHWLQAGGLFVPDAAKWWEPGNAEIIGAWMVGPFSGDFFVALGNLPFIILWITAAFELGRQIGLSGVWRHLAVLTMLATYTTFHEAEKAMNDVAVAACFFAAAAFGFRYLRSTRSPALILAGVATGLLAGVKYFALGYAALVIFSIVSGTILADGWRPACRSMFTLALAGVPFGAYWYLRNYLASGSALYPQGADALGTGYPGPLWSTTLSGNRSPELFGLTCEALWKMTGPCHVAAVVLAPVSAAGLVWAGARRLRGGARGEAAVAFGFCALLLGAAAVLAITPFCVQDQPGTLNHLRWAYTPARYGLCFLSLAAVAFAWLLQQFTQRVRALAAFTHHNSWAWEMAVTAATEGVFGAAAALQLLLCLKYLSHHPGFRANVNLMDAGFAGLIITAVIGFLTLAYRRQGAYRRVLAVGTAVSVVIGASIGAAMLSERWHRGYADYFDRLFGTRVFTRLARQPAGSIAVLDHRPYPFFGSARQYRVCAPRILTTYDALAEYLARRAPLIVASRSRNTGDPYDRYKQGPGWLKTHADEFEPLMASGPFQLFDWQGAESRSTDGALSNRLPQQRTLGATGFNAHRPKSP